MTNQQKATLLTDPLWLYRVHVMSYSVQYDAVGGRRDRDGLKFTSARASRYPAQLNFIFAQAIVEATIPDVNEVCPRSIEDPEWICGWEAQRDANGRSCWAAIIDSDQLMGP